MDGFNLTRNELKGLLGIAALLPVLCFVSGFFIARMDGSDQAPRERAAQPALAQIAPTVETTAISAPIAAAPKPHRDTPAIPAPRATVPPSVSDLMPVQTTYLVQAGLFSSEDNARGYIADLESRGLKAGIVEAHQQERTLYRIVLERFASEAQARQFIVAVQQHQPIELFVRKLETRATPLAAL